MSEDRPRRKLVVSNAAIPFVARGGRIFGRQLMDADLDIRDGEQVLVTDRMDHTLAVARAVL